MTSVKILICGDVIGNFRTLFSKVKDLNDKKGPFESLFCVGNFFGPNNEEYEELKSGKIEVPILTYILNGNQLKFMELYEPLEKAVPKIVYLGKKGSLTCASGLKIAYLSGVELPEKRLHKDKSLVTGTFQKYNIYISRDLVKSMVNGIGSGVDILLTSQWPKDVTNYGVSVDHDTEAKINDNSSYSVSILAKYLKPRYHFSGLSGVFYERIPYRNNIDLIEKPHHVTRFIGLAPVKRGKIDKQEKWLYAFTLTPQCSMSPQELLQNTGPTTVSPYGDTVDFDIVDRNFFFENNSINNPKPSTSKKRSVEDDFENESKRTAIDASSCWFCLSNPKVEKQLIITIGTHCYITLAKGVLVPEHVFIVPIEHTASAVELSPEAYEEMEKFKEALTKYFHERRLDVAFFERNYRSPHLQLQVIPIPRGLQEAIEDRLITYACKYDVQSLPPLASLKEITPGKSKNYFYFEHMVNKMSEGKYLAFIENSVKDFPLQIGRHILAEVLQLEARKDWQDCVDPVREAEMAENMRERFKEYDFTQDQDQE